MLRATGLALIAVLGFAVVAQAGPTRYNPRRAGHPLRVAAYILHPFGVIVDTLVFHPAWWLGQHEPLRTLFGVTTPIDDAEEVEAALRASEPEPLPEPLPEAPPPSTPPEPQLEPPAPPEPQPE